MATTLSRTARRRCQRALKDSRHRERGHRREQCVRTNPWEVQASPKTEGDRGAEGALIRADSRHADEAEALGVQPVLYDSFSSCAFASFNSAISKPAVNER